ncbi:MAG: PQQ-dependent sugar dehydrogenase [Leptolyngbyaceae cyanobacterium MAG.088]|nr:PQQ-dependent sugar dehydrogenase [Leptolyngbyaceae cyanobacterium MAG.088]
MRNTNLRYFLIGAVFLLLSLTTARQVAAQVQNFPTDLPAPIAQIFGIPESSLTVALEEIAQISDSGTGRNKVARLNFLTHAGDGSERLFVNDMKGKLYVIREGNTSVYMNLKALLCPGFSAQDSQQGFSYFAFHPEFVNNGIFYTVNSEEKDIGVPDFLVTQPIIDSNQNLIASSHHEVIREWQAEEPAANIFSGTMREILRIEQPYADHNIGQLGFNPNAKPGDTDYGMLYIALADGGSDGYPVRQTDPLDNGQNLSTPLGKILRIDPFGHNSSNGQYGIPSDNPFVDDDAAETLEEIWAYGLRNPHRFSWDTGGEGKMLIADIGQEFTEEINLGIKGANYGWDQREGTWVTDQNDESLVYPLPANDSQYGYTYPVAQYEHEIPADYPGFYGIAVAGGYVYRGQDIPELVGEYIFADFGSDARFFHVPIEQLVDGRQATIQELRFWNNGQNSSFLDIIGQQRSDARIGIDEAGELYVTSKQDGIVRKLVHRAKQNNNLPYLNY